MTELSTKPYLLRALHEWCSDCGYTPYITVFVDDHCVVPPQHVQDGQIVLNLSLSATNRLVLGNELIEFQARFGGVARDLSIPVSNVAAIYARETGHGMAFDVLPAPARPLAGEDASTSADTGADSLPPMPAGSDRADPVSDEGMSGTGRGRRRGRLSAVPDIARAESAPDPTMESGSAIADAAGGAAPEPEVSGPDAPDSSEGVTARGGKDKSKRTSKPRLTRVK